MTVESVGRGDVQHVVDALLRLTTTGRSVEHMLTAHPRLSARYQDSIPAFQFLRTFIVAEIKGIAETGCRKDEVL